VTHYPGLSRREALALAAGTLGALAVHAGPVRDTERRGDPVGGVLAPRPPMGWNSWNSFAGTITEAQALENARIMQRTLLPFGYEVFTIDIQWYEPEASGYAYNPNPVPALDTYGRLIPAPNRFPSSVDGVGFSKIAAEVHRLGLKFGIHVMRGIPRLAVERNLPVLGASVRARDIADTGSICAWNPDMYGVDMRKPGAQAYYDSIFALYASWGVDFVKMDDMSRPYDAHAAEIEAAHLAISRSGRAMMLSLSPGETPLVHAEHVREHAQMWRISDDFWDEWRLLEAQFVRLANWNPWRRPGAWPDADMLPLGRLAMGERESNFTPDEQRTLMSLWSIARSPLLMGGDLRHLDRQTLALLTNRDVLAVNQASTDNRPHYFQDGTWVWSARAQGSAEHYLALFNLTDAPKEVIVPLRAIGRTQAHLRDLWSGHRHGMVRDEVRQMVRAHGAELYRVS